MERKVAQTELEPSEYQTLAKMAEKKGLTIKEALGRRKAKDWGKGTENASKEVDETLYK